MNISFLKEKGSKYIVFILLGLLILVMCIPAKGEESLDLQGQSVSSEEDLEAQLERVLSSMEGVGEVKVMVTTEGGTESIYTKQTNSNKVCGVVVVAEGAGSPSVNAQIKESVKALFSIDVHKISIVKMRSQEETQ